MKTFLLEVQASLKKSLAILIDPDQNAEAVANIAQLCDANQVDFIFVGGSLVGGNQLTKCIQTIKTYYKGLVYLFPGNEMMVDPNADGILFLSLLSGRNPEYLIGKQVVAAPYLVQTNLDILPTAYLLIDGGRETSVSYMSNTKPIPADKYNIAVATALAGKMLGMQCIYMDAGSGAFAPIAPKMIEKVKQNTGLPLIIGGGIRSAETAIQLYKAGADVLVIGNGVEDNHQLIQSIANAKQALIDSIA